jgi:nucleoside diphosphate kinase
MVYVEELKMAVCSVREIEESYEGHESGVMLEFLVDYLARLAEGK